MSPQPLILAVPSKGRLKEQVEAWLADCGLPLRAAGGARGYMAEIEGLGDVQVRLASAGDIAAALAAGDIQIGLTGEDLLREQGDAFDRMHFLAAPGFGRADLVVAAPKSWLDVEVMADVEDLAHAWVARTGRRLRVATKYVVQTRAFFARCGIADYRITESSGATEGAPAAGLAELVVDITTTGATLEANGLRPLADGVILRSQAQLAASLAADWTGGHIEACRRLMIVIEARARARAVSQLRWPAEHDTAAQAAIAPFAQAGGAPGAHSAFASSDRLLPAAWALAGAGVGPVAIERPDYVFEPSSAAVETLQRALGQADDLRSPIDSTRHSVAN